MNESLDPYLTFRFKSKQQFYAPMNTPLLHACQCANAIFQQVDNIPTQNQIDRNRRKVANKQERNICLYRDTDNNDMQGADRMNTGSARNFISS